MGTIYCLHSRDGDKKTGPKGDTKEKASTFIKGPSCLPGGVHLFLHGTSREGPYGTGQIPGDLQGGVRRTTSGVRVFEDREQGTGNYHQSIKETF